jgi:hypothetical protein
MIYSVAEQVPLGTGETYSEVFAGFSAFVEAASMFIRYSFIGSALAFALAVTLGVFVWRWVSQIVKG